MSWLLAIVKAGFQWFAALIVATGIVFLMLAWLFGQSGDEVRVLYLDGQRICEGGYDFRSPACRHVFAEERRRRMRDIQWGVVNKNTGLLVRYDGWYIERSEIEKDLENNTIPADVPHFDRDDFWLMAALEDYEEWGEVDWERVHCRAEVLSSDNPTQRCQDLYHGRVLSLLEIERNERIETRRTWVKWIGAIFLALVLLGIVDAVRTGRLPE